MTKQNSNPLPEIPDITNGELKDAIRVLVRSSDLYRQLFFQVASGDADVKTLLTENLELLTVADSVIELWIEEPNIRENDNPAEGIK